MAGEFVILGIAGSLRQKSYNRGALRAATELVPPGVRIDVFELNAGIPGFSEDDEQRPPAIIVDLKKRIRAADAVLFVTPEYNYSVPGVLKNVIDWASRPYGDNAWDGKPAAIMGASPGGGGTARAQYHLRQMMVWLNMLPINRPEILIAKAATYYDEAGNLRDAAIRERIGKQIEALVAWTRRLEPAGR